jgi:hypothetical protein
MIDHRSPSPEGRIDLRALSGAADDPGRTDAVAAAVMARIVGRAAEMPYDIASLRRVQRRLLALAAVLVAAATATVYATPSSASVTDASALLASWTESGHVPTNAELLAVYQGYRP